MLLKLNIDGLSPDQRARGVTAAQKVFDDAGVTALQAAAAAFKQEAPDYPELTEREGRAAVAWRDADREAARAACADWADPPTSAELEVVYEPAELERARSS